MAWLNGMLVPELEAAVSIDDRGFRLGDGLFETMRAYGGRVFRLQAHLDRLTAGAARLGIDPGPRLAEAVEETVAANRHEEAAVRLILSRGASGEGFAPEAAGKPTLVVTARPYRPQGRWYEDGVSGWIPIGRLNERSPSVGLKRLGFLDQILAQAEARAAKAEEAILLDTGGHLAEAAVANLFLVLGDRLYTPPLACGPLPGITRAAVIDLADEMGMKVHEVALPASMLEAASEAFLTNSLRELVPLVSVAGRPVGRGRPGPLTKRFLEAYRQLV